ncbi:MAG: hypothetical protein GY782_11805, partial [Gammaproteobacteria bacterium]|nr:hypothetical protein [Gammaproteobacteria bacterium]
MAVPRSFWVNILTSQTCIEIHTLRENDYLTQGNINKCKNSKNPFWQETFRTFTTVQNNFLEEFPEHRLLQLVNGNNQVTHDGKARQIISMSKKTLAHTVNPDFTIMSTTQYMANHSEIMWLKKPKICADYNEFKNNFTKYVDRSAIYKPILDTDTTLNKVILNKVKKGCSFYYKCLTYHKRKSFNWDKQKANWEQVLNKTYENDEWDQIINSLRNIKNNNFHKEHQLRILRNNIFTNKRLAHHVQDVTKYCDYCTDTVEDVLHHVYECPKSQYVWRITEAILNQAGETVYIDAEHAIFGFV